jgi:excisionase family DNA binding protein
MSGNTVTDRALLTVPEAAALAGLSKAVAYRLAAEDRLPGLLRLPGRRLRVRRRVLEAWLAGDDGDGAETGGHLGGDHRSP